MTRKRRPTDVNQLARFLVDASTKDVGEPPITRNAQISEIMREMGRKRREDRRGTRRENMTAQARSESASFAARARWGFGKPVAVKFKVEPKKKASVKRKDKKGKIRG